MRQACYVTITLERQHFLSRDGEDYMIQERMSNSE